MPPDVTAVVGNHQGEQLLGDCLASLRTQTQPPAAVIVADGDSTDGSAAVAEREGASVLRLPNSGLGFLYNRGADLAATPLVLFLNNDVALDPGCVQRLAQALDDEPRRFAADAQQLDWAGERVIHARTTLRRGRLLKEYIPGLHLDSVVPASGVATTVCANAAAMLVRRSMFVELGGFDEAFFMEWEDLDLCWRAWLRGWPSVYVPAALVRHRVGAATSAGVRLRRSASSHHNLVRFAFKCLPAVPASRVVLGELLRLPRHPRPVTLGLATAAAEAPAIVRLRQSLQPTHRTFAELLAL